MYNNIRKKTRTKTKLLEVQLQIHGEYKTIVQDDRYFISYLIYLFLYFILLLSFFWVHYNLCKPCQMRRKLLHKKYKGITVYLFSDLFVWVSVRGKYKGSYSLYNTELQIEKSGKVGDAEFSVGLATEKNKRLVVCANDGQWVFFCCCCCLFVRLFVCCNKNKKFFVLFSCTKEQRDSVLARITDAQRKCFERSKNAT
ncbi:hypothetical protein RFI_11387 [Reticulomyxa filosa]|uniref:Uncharacterized protein n=1 Tax=Reticulomyxa filosa TaxID=46433 RepID=X6NJ33_RETFI|nr:hypothetical protein RFI_11387 [Reticulomyxa filosa]|eukprot:ETO25754.1 hypothetical protein RFI_11387 [Reticulomyxa filosa]